MIARRGGDHPGADHHPARRLGHPEQPGPDPRTGPPRGERRPGRRGGRGRGRRGGPRGGRPNSCPRRDRSSVVFATDDRQLAAPRGTRPHRPAPAAGGSTPPAPRDPGTADATLVCPLWLEPLAVARPSGGALVLTGRRDVLTASRDALEVLAGQAALALDRISLVEAVGRRDSDLYLRAVIRNTADIMLVIDDDQRHPVRQPRPARPPRRRGPPAVRHPADLSTPTTAARSAAPSATDGDGVALLRPAPRRPDPGPGRGHLPRPARGPPGPGLRRHHARRRPTPTTRSSRSPTRTTSTNSPPG